MSDHTASGARTGTLAHIETVAIHGGQHADPTHGAVMQPIVMASTFAQPEPGQPLRYDYSRSGNPTRSALEAALGALEGGNHAFAFGSGCGAAATFFHTLRPGDHVVCGDDVYGGTYRLFATVVQPMGVDVSFVDLRILTNLEAAITPRTRLVWLETPTNPMLKLVDIAAAAAIARQRGIPVVVDNTFASPILQRPLALGATAVVHSTTKYINGHSDVVGGAIVTNDDELAKRLRFLQNAIGAVPSPMDCYLVLRGIKTLPLRMRRHCETAAELALRLESRRGIVRVHYPGLKSHPQHELALRQMVAPGGMISFEIDGGLEESRRFLCTLRIFTLAESLGGVESLAEHPAIMTHASIPADVRHGLGISDSLVRLSVGLEHVEDLWADLDGALSAARGA
ncbi:MAG TPA: PLP-dependent aspartate aminotransferase family protein [Polyangia bacterium]